MTSDELNRAIEFLTKQAAEFWAGMDEMKTRQDREHKELRSSIKELKEQTARFESWAAQVVAIESKRLDEHDQLHRNTLAVHAQAIHLLHLLLDRLPPAKN
jgi:hypothetical protein